jgi:uncharacterized membrane protein YsdA (DUF1294 family)
VDNRHTNPYIFFGSFVAGIAVLATMLAYLYFDTSVVGSYGIGVGVAGFFLMGLDKSLAGSSSLRVPEKVLFAVALLGGGGGVFFGMHMFRHKTKKVAFQCVLMLIFMAQFFVAAQLGVEFRNH